MGSYDLSGREVAAIAILGATYVGVHRTKEHTTLNHTLHSQLKPFRFICASLNPNCVSKRER